MTEPHATPVPGVANDDVRWDRFASVWGERQVGGISPVRARASTLAIGLWSAGAVALFVGWNGAARYPSVELQLPYLITTSLLVLAAGAGGVIAHVAGVIAGGRRAVLDAASGSNDGPSDHDVTGVGPVGSGARRRGSTVATRRRQLVAGVGAVAVALGTVVPLSPALAGGESAEDRLGLFVESLENYATELDLDVDDLRRLHAAGPLSRVALNIHVVRSQVAGAPTLDRLLGAAQPVAVDLVEGRLSPERVGVAVRDPLVAIASSVARSGRLAAELSARSAGSRGQAGVREDEEIDPDDLLVPVFQLTVEAMRPILDVIESAEPVLRPLEDVFEAACVDGLGLVQLGVNVVPALIELPTLPVDLAQLVNGALTPVFLVCSAVPTPANAPDDSQSASPPPAASAPPPPSSPSPSPPAEPPAPLEQPPSISDIASFVPAPPSDASASPAGAGDRSAGVAAPGPAIPAAPLDPVSIAFDRSVEQAGLVALVALCAVMAALVRRWRPQDGWEVCAGAAGLTASVGAAILTWNGVAASATSWIQMPYVLSGVGAALLFGMAGSALTATPMIESLHRTMSTHR